MVCAQLMWKNHIMDKFMPASSYNPFVYGRPVEGENFLGRQKELVRVLNRLRNKESTAIIGDPHIGKTSFLRRLANSQELNSMLGENLGFKVVPCFIDLYALPEYNQISFWREVIVAFRKNSEKKFSKAIRELEEKNYDRRALEKWFSTLTDSNYILFLLLDEFDVLLRHKNFQDPDFFAGLRKFISTVGGVVMVISSRINISEMNLIGYKLRSAGSPFFNTFVDVRLYPFDGDIVNGEITGSIGELLNQKEAGFTIDQTIFIKRMAGRHPYVLQAMAAAVYENPQNLIEAAKNCYESISFHFSDIWEYLPENCRVAAIMLSLVELGGKARGSRFNFEGIENNEKFGSELSLLEKSGLAECVEEREGWILDWKYFLVWRGQRWAVGSQLFAWWIHDQIIINETGPVSTWLSKNKYLGMLTTQEWNQLVGVWKDRPEWIKEGLKKVTQIILGKIPLS